MELLFATHNAHKVKELQSVAAPGLTFHSLTDIGWTVELEENAETLEENALQKARQLFAGVKKNCFADDTGLIVPALGGEPGVFSARYAGPQRSAEDNMDKLLRELEGKKDRSAYFRTVIALIIKGEEHVFVGESHGHILHERRGEEGFGYDPLFLPEGKETTFAEMAMEEKNAISHRKRAFSAMLEYLSCSLESSAGK